MCQKMAYVTLIEGAGLSSKENAIKHSRGHNIHSIVIKVSIHVVLIKIQVLSEN